jgi:hypothetical protein
MQLKPKKELPWPTHQSIPPFNNWGIWMFNKQVDMFLYICANAIWSF